MTHFGLGKGLESLIPKRKGSDQGSNDDNNQSLDRIMKVPLDKIKLNPHQPRKNFDNEDMQELASSIKLHGIIQPLIVTRDDNDYQLIAGERRLRAARILELDQVPVIIKEAEDRDKLELALIENIQRENLNPIEEALAYNKLIDNFGLTQQEIANQISKSRSQVANMLRLLKLPQEIQDAIKGKRISFGHAKVILGLDDSEKQLRFFHDITKRSLSVRDSERQASQFKPPRVEKAVDPILVEKEKMLEGALGTKAKIKKKGERGVIEIAFYSDEELYNLINKISSDNPTP